MAIKVFSGRSYHYDYVSRKREIDVIKQLSEHENIVKLLAVEQQVSLHQGMQQLSLQYRKPVNRQLL